MPKRRYVGSSYSPTRRRRVSRRAAFRKRSRSRRSKLGRPSRGMSQSTYMFKRSITEVVALTPTGDSAKGWLPASGDASDNGLYKQWNFSLNQLLGEGKTDFTNLFKRYKINGVKLELSFSNTGSDVVTGTNPINGQLQVYTTPNRSGRARDATNPLTEEVLMNTQAKKKRLALNGGHPLKYFMKVKQLGMIYVSPTDTDYTTQRPQYVSTTEPGAVHYGSEMYINRVDGKPLTTGNTGSQFVRITTTFYFSFKGVE